MYQRILVPLDGSSTAERGLREAVRLAADQAATLCLLHVMDDFPLMMEMASATNFEELRRSLHEHGDKLLTRAREEAVAGGVKTEVLLREVSHARIGEVIVEEATKAGCDLIVMGSHGRTGFNRLVMGSVADLVVRTSTLPILLLRTVAEAP